jgi:ABC-2 type transport system ATP-binding protein
MKPIISINGLSKTYSDGFLALKSVDLDIRKGEILALLGPNGAGKTTLINIVCGLVNASAGSVSVDGHDIVDDYRATRSMIGMVPQEISLDPFEKALSTVELSRGLFGLRADRAHLEKVLRSLTLWDKRDAITAMLSGGMKRRLMIAKALVHEPQILFLDEPTAGVDVELRKDMWRLIRKLKSSGVTIILTTHYIEEAEDIADRVAVINHGEIIIVEDKAELMRKLGKKQLTLELAKPLDQLPAALTMHDLSLSEDGARLTYTYDKRGERTGITALLNDLNNCGIKFSDLNTTQSSLEDIFVDLVKQTS